MCVSFTILDCAAKGRAIAIPVDLDCQVNNLFMKSNNIVQKTALSWRLSVRNATRRDSVLTTSRDYRNIIERLQVNEWNCICFHICLLCILCLLEYCAFIFKTCFLSIEISSEKCVELLGRQWRSSLGFRTELWCLFVLSMITHVSHSNPIKPVFNCLPQCLTLLVCVVNVCFCVYLCMRVCVSSGYCVCLGGAVEASGSGWVVCIGGCSPSSRTAVPRAHWSPPQVWEWRLHLQVW